MEKDENEYGRRSERLSLAFAFSRCISRSASRIPSRDRPREYRLSWPLDTIPDPFAITRMHRTQRQCFETIRDCRLRECARGVTSTCTYTCTHADTSTGTLSLLLFRCRTLLRVRGSVCYHVYSRCSRSWERRRTAMQFGMIIRFLRSGD